MLTGGIMRIRGGSIVSVSVAVRKRLFPVVVKEELIPGNLVLTSIKFERLMHAMSFEKQKHSGKILRTQHPTGIAG